MEEEETSTLSVASFIKKIDERIAALMETLVTSSDHSQNDVNRGKIRAFREAKEILLNKKKKGV